MLPKIKKGQIWKHVKDERVCLVLSDEYIEYGSPVVRVFVLTQNREDVYSTAIMKSSRWFQRIC